jgi:hypothetical protein
MKIEVVIHSSDSNPMYLDFWPLVSKVWNVRFGLRPLLVYIDENHTIPIDTTYGDVIKMKPVPDIPIYLQCQWVRFWITTRFMDKICMTSDIDMFPVSKQYFIDMLKNVSDDKYVHLNATTLPGGTDIYLPVCYHVAKGSVFCRVLGLDASWETSMRMLANLPIKPNEYNQRIEYLKDKPQWGIEEEYTTHCILTYSDKSILLLVNRKHARIDRDKWEWTEQDIKADAYADSHSIRPYRDPENTQRIDALVEYLVRRPTLQNLLHKRL